MTRIAQICLALTLGGLAACLSGAPAGAKDGVVPVDVELIFAVDISYSMDAEEQRLQRGGYVTALQSKEFLAALANGAHQKIAVSYMEWASSYDQTVLINWTVIDGPESAAAFAKKLDDAPYRRASRTSVSGAIDKAVVMFANNGYDGVRRVIDVSGDGPNNNGRPVLASRDEAVAKGFIINGLPLMIRPVRSNLADIEELDIYYADCVVGGPGSFMIPVRDTKDFVEATRTKLVLDVAQWQPAMGARTLPAQAREPRIDCMIGEKRFQSRWGN